MCKVIILCGGHGKRLWPLTSYMPKPLVALGGKPLLKHILDFYIHKGFHDFVLCVGFRAEIITQFVSSYAFNAKIEISNSGVHAGMLKRIYDVRSHIDNEAIITYGDTFINFDPYHIIKKHREDNALITITTADIRSPFGLVRCNNNKVISFEEKPILQYYIGCMILNKEVLEDIDSDLISMPDGEGLVRLFQRLIKKRRLSVYKHEGLKITFNSPSEYKKAEEEFIKFFTEQEG